MKTIDLEKSDQVDAPQSAVQPGNKGESRSVAAIVLAAGKGTRMKSNLAKVLHRAAGLPMLDWVVRSLKSAGVEQQVIIVSPAMAKAIGGAEWADWQRFGSAIFCCQNIARGTGDAVASAWPAFCGVAKPPFVDARLVPRGSVPVSSEPASGDGAVTAGALPENGLQVDDVIVCAGDTPALSSEGLREFIDVCHAANAEMGVLAMRVPDPKGYGRIVTDEAGNLVAIVEERDATAEQKEINSCNSGVIFAKAAVLFEMLSLLDSDNSQGEFYLTDCLGFAVQKNLKVVVHEGKNHADFAGVNDRSQLAAVEVTLVTRMIDAFMKSGVTFHNPGSCYIEADCRIGSDSEIGPGVTITSRTQIGRNCQVGPNVTLDDVEAGDGCVIGAGSVIRNYVVNPGEYVPPLSMIH